MITERSEHTMKYVTVPIQPPATNATIKPKEDIADILCEDGFEVIKIFREQITTDPEELKYFIEGTIAMVKQGDLVLFQTPMYAPIEYEIEFHRQIKEHGAKIVEIFHDVDFMRFDQPTDKYQELVSYTDAMIVASEAMKEAFIRLDYQKPIIVRQLFDYLDHNQIIQKKHTNTVYFAGNVQDALFLQHIPENVYVKAYGFNEDQVLPSNVDFKGGLSADLISTVFTDGWGLVWNGDGNGIVNGRLGEYLKITWPHKLSLYIQSGLPVIVWSESLAAKFVREKRLGIVVDNLNDLEEKLNQVDDVLYDEYCSNCRKISQLLRDGFFTKLAVNKTINSLMVK